MEIDGARVGEVGLREEVACLRDGVRA